MTYLPLINHDLDVYEEHGASAAEKLNITIGGDNKMQATMGELQQMLFEHCIAYKTATTQRNHLAFGMGEIISILMEEHAFSIQNTVDWLARDNGGKGVIPMSSMSARRKIAYNTICKCFPRLLMVSIPWSEVCSHWSKLGVLLDQRRGPWFDVANRLKNAVFEESSTLNLKVS